MDILDFFLSIRLNIKIIRRVYIYRIIERTEENRNSRGGNLLDCPGRKKLLDSGISVDYSPFHYSDPSGGSYLVLCFRKDFFFLLRINVSGGSSITEERNCYIFLFVWWKRSFIFIFSFFFFFHSIIALPVLSTVNQVKHRGGTRDVDVSKAVLLSYTFRLRV